MVRNETDTPPPLPPSNAPRLFSHSARRTVYVGLLFTLMYIDSVADSVVDIPNLDCAAERCPESASHFIFLCVP